MSPDPAKSRVLVLGYGNPGRQDDGLGPAAALAVQNFGVPGLTVEINYLLNIEDSADAAEHDCVLFLDAAETGPEPFDVREVAPAEEIAFTSHIVKPEVIVAICRKHFGRMPRAWLMAIRGYEFELEEGLTDAAKANLERAITHLHLWLTN
jgi:hydrogenase maturation protease